MTEDSPLDYIENSQNSTVRRKTIYLENGKRHETFHGRGVNGWQISSGKDIQQH